MTQLDLPLARRGATIKEIAARCRLDKVQVARRMVSMARRGLVGRRGELKCKPGVVGATFLDCEKRNGCAVWWVV